PPSPTKSYTFPYTTLFRSKLGDVAERKKLYDGGKTAVEASKDPMILLARIIDKDARAVRKIIEDQVEEPKRQAYDKIAKAKFARSEEHTSELQSRRDLVCR